MSDFKPYRRTNIAWARPYVSGEDMAGISVSPEDAKRESLDGGMIARNPANHDDQWYIATDYFAENFEPIEGAP